ncbi:MAG: phosphoenolpyruvate-utilizing N-terminal domain-containing protein [Desulfuromonadales bacterium]
MRTFTGIAASPGIAVGKLCVIDRRRAAISEYTIAPEAVSSEISRLHAAISATRDNLESLKSRLTISTGEDHLFFIETHLLILDDERLVSETAAIIETWLINTEAALRRTLNRYQDFFSGIDDPYLRERISDVETVIERVL